MDPSAAIVENGKVLAFSEEERHVRIKHAQGILSNQRYKYCLAEANCQFSEIESVSINWDIDAYSDGRMQKFYHSVRENTM